MNYILPRNVKCKVMLTEANLEPSRISTMEIFCENSEQPLAINYFCKNAPS